MKTEIPNRRLLDESTVAHHPRKQEEPKPVEEAAEEQPPVYRSEKLLILEEGAEIASHICLKSGNPVCKHIHTSIRNPFHPGTWFKPIGTAVIGLSQDEMTRYLDKLSSAWSLIALGLLLTIAGFFAGSLFAIIGSIMITTGLIMRAICPIWSPSSPDSKKVAIRGCGEPFLDLFPEKE